MRIQSPASTYLLVFFLLIFFFLLPVFSSGFSQQPVSGDLTRIGYYSENEFGWTGDQIAWTEPLFTLNDPGQEFDIVVIGDSFSDSPNISWINTLAAGSGLRIGFFKFGSDLGSIINPRSHQPPSILILQVVERTLFHRFVDKQTCGEYVPGETQTKSPGFNPLQIHPLTSQPKTYSRDMNAQGLLIDIGFEFKKLINTKSLKVRSFGLTRPDLFSNASSAEILVYHTDFQKEAWHEGYWKRIACGVNTFRHEIEEDGFTQFVFMVAPDTSTIYGQYGVEGDFSTSKLDEFFRHSDSRSLDLRPIFEELIVKGIKDIYLPNDTHWSPRTQTEVGKEMLNFLEQSGLVTDSSVQSGQSKVEIE